MEAMRKQGQLGRWARTVALQFLFWVAVNTVYAVIYIFGGVEKALPSQLVTLQDLYLPLLESFPWILFGSTLFSLLIGTTDYIENNQRRSKHTFFFQVARKFLFYLAGLVIGCLVPIFTWILFSGASKFNSTFAFFLPRMASIIFFAMIALLILSYIQQLAKNIGRNNMLRILLGKYYHPKTEDWMFMFLDLKGSTTIAEKTGHRRFAVLIQELFFILNSLAERYGAEIYKYVGDEAILCWDNVRGSSACNCLRLFFGFRNELEQRREHFLNNYGVMPEFKAGVHLGEVTVAEVGDIKREISFYGDVVNTAARIESSCNALGCSLVISEAVYNVLAEDTRALDAFETTEFPGVDLRGKQVSIMLYGVGMR